MKIISVMKAEPSSRGNVEDCLIIISDNISEEFFEEITVAELGKIYSKQAELLASVLLSSLPGGTLDRLTAKLLEFTASNLMVTK